MSNILSPSILAADFTRLGEQIAVLDEAGAQYVHIDVMDGIFVPSISFGMPLISSVRKATGRVFDVHLMIERPERYISEFAECGADLITFHLEATDRAEAVIEDIHGRGLKAGLAIKPETDAETVRPYLGKADMILVMTVEPGYGGQKYIDYCSDKVRSVRRMVLEAGTTTDIEVDGGITRENVADVLRAGANVIVAGSAIFHGDIRENVACFLNMMGTR